MNDGKVAVRRGQKAAKVCLTVAAAIAGGNSGLQSDNDGCGSNRGNKKRQQQGSRSGTLRGILIILEFFLPTILYASSSIAVTVIAHFSSSFSSITSSSSSSSASKGSTRGCNGVTASLSCCHHPLCRQGQGCASAAYPWDWL